jgi:hypothetical protein
MWRFGRPVPGHSPEPHPADPTYPLVSGTARTPGLGRAKGARRRCGLRFEPLWRYDGYQAMKPARTAV